MAMKWTVRSLITLFTESGPSGSSLRGGFRFHWELTRFMSRVGHEELTDLISGLKHNDPYVRWCVAHALGVLGPGRAVQPLLCALRDPSKDVRERAGISLKAVCQGEPSDEALEVMISCMEDHDSDVRSCVVSALGGLKSPKLMTLVPDLINTLSNGNKKVRRAAATSLSQITGKSFVFSNANPQKWSNWWEAHKERLLGEQ
jgi:HEAT repeat protein